MFFPGGGSGGGGVSALQNDQFVATPAQTVFALSAIPTSAVIMIVDGVSYEDIVDFTIVAASATWLNTDFALSGGEKVQFYYIV